MTGEKCVERVGALEALPGVEARFLTRIPEMPCALERGEALERLAPMHRAILRSTLGGDYPLVTADQVHGTTIAEVTEPTMSIPIPRTDGLMTRLRGVTLGIHVADCAPVWIVARDGSDGALLHSGRKGTELGIVPRGIAALTTLTGRPPGDLLLVVGPCIRPPCYETDFATAIRAQARDAGVRDIHDEGVCTACHPERYYSYRRELGKTGRMLATLTLIP